MTKPRMPVRRFDVFAEYNRQEAIKKGMAADEAEGYGLWVAKVVASGGGRGPALRRPAEKDGKAEKESETEGKEEEPKSKWRSLSGEDQTDEMFQKEIVKRMGAHFYETVFVPAIEDALAEDRTYQSIRDTIRRDWKP